MQSFTSLRRPSFPDRPKDATARVPPAIDEFRDTPTIRFFLAHKETSRNANY